MDLSEKYKVVEDNKQVLADALVNNRKGRGLFGFDPDEILRTVKEAIGFELRPVVQYLMDLGVIVYLDLEDDEVDYFNSFLEPDYHRDNDHSYYVSLESRKDIDDLDYYLVRRLRDGLSKTNIG